MTNTAASVAPAFNAFRQIDDGQRLAIHRVAIDDSGAVVAWEPEPVRLEVPSSMAGGSDVSAATLAHWRISSLAFGSANCTFTSAPVLQLVDGRLIDMPTYGGEDAEPARAPKALIAA